MRERPSLRRSSPVELTCEPVDGRSGEACKPSSSIRLEFEKRFAALKLAGKSNRTRWTHGKGEQPDCGR